MSEGIQETKEALEAINLLSLDLIKIFKKHLGAVSAGAAILDLLLADEELKAALTKGFEGISKVPAEIKDLDVSEVVQLVVDEAALAPQLIDALKS